MGLEGDPVGSGDPLQALRILLLTAGAGGSGAVLRLLVTCVLPRRGVDVVNVLGTGLFALILALHGRGGLTDASAIVLGLGLCGSLTTFSGWMAVLTRPAPGTVEPGAPDDARVRVRTARPSIRTTLGPIVLPLLAGVAVVVLVFATIGGTNTL
jgi:hypothetical protein